MTYHHLNRFKAHSWAEITPSERLIAWHFAYETRETKGYYSESQRRLENTLDLDRRTLQKSLARLVDLGLFSREDKGGTHAPIYRLLVQCPEECLETSEHNTKRELAAQKDLVATNTPPLSDKNTAPYIEKREEEEVSPSEILGKRIIVLIRKTLEPLEEKTADHFTLQGFLELDPVSIIQAAFKILETNQIDTWKRQEGYLKQVATRDPKKLLEYAEIARDLNEFTRQRVEEAFKAEPKLSKARPNPTKSRLQQFELEALSHLGTPLIIMGREEEDLASAQFMFGLMSEGVLDKIKAGSYALQYSKPYLNQASETFPECLSHGAIEILFYLEENIKGFYREMGIEPNFMLDYQLAKLKTAYLGITFSSFGILPELDFLLTPEQLDQLTARREAINEAKTAWRIANKIEGDYTPAQFWQDPATKKVLADFPEPLTQQQKEENIISMLSQMVNVAGEILFAELDFNGNLTNPESKKTREPGSTYREFLDQNFTWQDDLNEFLDAYPKRPEGNQNFSDTSKAFLELRRYLRQEDIIQLAENYAKQLGTTFPQNPHRWLKNQIAEKSGLGVIR